MNGVRASVGGGYMCLLNEGEVEGGAQRLIIFIDRKKVLDLVWTLPRRLLWRDSNYLRIF